MNTPNSQIEPPHNWNWIDESNWNGYCKKTYMQSPIDIKPSESQTDYFPKIDYSFSPKIDMKIKTHGEEVIVDFTNPNDTGFFNIYYGDTNFPKKAEFNPSGIYFRFRAEHPIISQRYDGEIVIVFNQKTKNNDPVNNL